MRTTCFSLLVPVLAAVLARPAPAADQFYEARLQEGRITYQTGIAAEAADLLRIACFGLLDEPRELSEGLVWLALAQNKAGRQVDADQTLKRFLDVEKRFAPYSKMSIPESVRAEFEELLVKRLPPTALAAVPTLAHFVETADQKILKLPLAARVKALEAKAKASPKESAWPLMLASLAADQKNPKEAIRWATRVLEIDRTNIEARTLMARAHMERHDFAGALGDLGKLPPEQLIADPSLAGDMFVCLVETRKWEAARAALGGLPPEQLKRPDVAAAARKVPLQKVVVVSAGSENLEVKAREVPAGSPSNPPAETPAKPPLKPALPEEQPAAKPPAASPTPTPKAPDASPRAKPADAEPPDAKPPAARPREAAPATQGADALREQAQRSLAAGKPAQAKDEAQKAVALAPKDRDARRILLEAAILTKDWQTAAAQGRALSPFQDGEEPMMLYAAVGLYETGKAEEARPLMRRAYPRITRNAFADYYAKALLRPESLGETAKEASAQSPESPATGVATDASKEGRSPSRPPTDTTAAPRLEPGSPQGQPAAKPPDAAPVARPPAAAPAAPRADVLREQAQRSLAAGKAAQAKDEAQKAVALAPKDRDARGILLEAAILTKDWQTAAAQGRALSPFRSGEETLMFYAAVGLYEIGKAEEARPLMRRAYPRIARNAFVDYYAKALLP